jgi:acetylornithine/succinyldiaminopimelate/putrescine aminotransferase/predicted amino acid dehydrogenase
MAVSPFEEKTAPSRFEKYANPAIGELTRRIGLDKAFVWGKGSYLRDAEGTSYLDFLGAYGALPFGHSPDHILDVLASFRETCEPMFVQPSALCASGELAERLLQIAPGNYRSVTFQNSGAETVEAALKACIAATGRRRILSTHRSFHGKTLAALSATGSGNYQDVFHAPYEGFDFVDFGDAPAIRRVLASLPTEYAAVILEPIQAEGGVNVPANGYLAAVRAACDEFGVLLIIDEVQTGLGRTGVMFAIEREGIQADCLLLAKALGGGAVPIGACLLSDRATSDDFQRKHSSTFGGNSLACRVGIQVLNKLTEHGSNLIADVAANGSYLLASLRALAARFSNLITEVRGEGYLIGVEFDVHRGCYEQYFGGFLGVIGEQENLVPLIASYLLNVEKIRVAPTLNGANTMRVEPPLTATRAECDFFLAAFERTLVLIDTGNTGAFLAHLLGGTPAHHRIPAVRHTVAIPNTSVERFGFLLHPLELKNYAEFDESLSNYSESALAMLESRLVELMDPFYVSTVRLQSCSSGKVVEGDFIMVPRSASQLAAMPMSDATALIEKAIKIARDRGARLVGLGGHTSIVTGGGLRAASSGVPVTTGNTYTMLTAVDASCAALTAVGRSMKDLQVAVVGATGSIGSAIARLIGAKAHRLTLVGNPKSAQFNRARFSAVIRNMVDYASLDVARETGSVLAQISARLASGLTPEQLAETLMSENGQIINLTYSNVPADALANADLVLVATSSTERFIQPSLLKTGAIVCDISRPANVSADITEIRPDVLVIDGGIVEAPGRPKLGSRFGIPEDMAYACMAETMLLSLGGIERNTSLGLDLNNGDLELLQRLASEHGFRVTGFRSFDKPLHPSRWAQYAAQHAQASADLSTVPV